MCSEDAPIESTEGMVSDILSFSINDGPGIRTTVFLKGCPLRCLWCHNPENLSADPRPMRVQARCIGCGRCAAACPLGLREADGDMRRADACVGCGACASVCPTGALSMVGSRKTAGEVYAKVARDLPFYRRSGGGVTLSGGEPLFQPAFSLALLTLCHEGGISTAVETSGFASDDTIRRIAPVTDLFLYDCKETDESRHRRFTGVSSRRIRDNLRLLSDLDADIILRCPIIPGVNDRKEHLRALADIARHTPGIRQIDLMPYHSLGISKARQLGITQQEEYREPDAPMKESWREVVIKAGWENTQVR